MSMSIKLQVVVLSVIGILYITNVQANNDKNSLGGRSAALGTASVTFTDVYSVFANQAGLANLNQLSVSLYAENRFLVSDLNTFAIAAAYPTNSGTFGIGASYFGTSDFNETQVKLAYGRKLFEKLAIGAEIDVVALSITESGSKATATFGLGVQYQITEHFKMGAHVFNPLRIQLTELEGTALTANDQDRLPSLIKLGVAYSPAEKVTVFAEAEKNIDEKAIYKGGIEYRLIEKIHVRVGVSSNPTRSSFGVGVNLGALKIDVASSFHPVLGYSPQLSLTYSGKK